MQILEIGTYLGKRYEIVEKIGEGGMAEVYRARDAFLNRAVAVKVLRPQYAGDEEFVERFRREAQAAASLSHPNVVSIFDVGEEKGIYYIIMEYIRGKNLKEIIRERAPLSPTEAVEIGIQICDALSHAHQNGIVHRDVKPHNILITREGRVKVTDFGIARAANSASLTETGIIIGSVHYFSPEQAKGAIVGVESDLYSLGVILYELLTGKVPFSAESPIATALQHIDGVPLRIRKLNPDVPPSLEGIVMRALEKEPEKRYRTASEFGMELKSFLNSLRAGASRGEEHLSDVSEDTIIMKRERYRDTSGDLKARRPDGGSVKEKGYTIPVGDDVTLIESMEEDDLMAETRKKRGSTTGKRGSRREGDGVKRGGILRNALSFLFITGLFIFLAIWGFQKIPALLYVPEVPVPDVRGRELTKAESLLRERRLVPKVWREVYDPDVAKGFVIAQTPEPEEIVKINRTILLTVSKGPEMVEVPDLLRKSLREAEIALTEAGLLVGTRDYKEFADIEEGLIVSQEPAARTLVKKGTYVNLILSKGGPVLLKVPDLRGMSLEMAEKTLTEAGFVKGTVTEDYSNDVVAGLVMAQDPPPGSELQAGGRVDFMISRGPGDLKGDETATPAEGNEGSGGGGNTTEPGGGNSGSGNSDSSWLKGYNVNIVVPPGPSRQRVRIVVIDVFGEREAYNEIHRPGDRIFKYLQGTGNVRIKVYIDGNLFKEFPEG